MPRCLNCNEKFTPKVFLQKFCGQEPCLKAENEWKATKVLTKTFQKSDLKLKSIPKIPKCKGLSIAVGHGCGTPQEKRIHGLGIDCKCYSKWLLGTPEGAEKLKRITLKVTSPRIELEQASTDRKDRAKLNTLLSNVKISCHEYIRLRDKGKPCVSCETPFLPNFQAGHFYKAELYSNLKFDEKNISGQCQKCNLRKEGNESGYRAGIIQRHGMDYLKYLDDKAKAYKKNDYHWDRIELEEIRKYYQAKLKELQS
jgi:hypothetical protein